MTPDSERPPGTGKERGAHSAGGATTSVAATDDIPQQVRRRREESYHLPPLDGYDVDLRDPHELDRPDPRRAPLSAQWTEELLRDLGLWSAYQGAVLRGRVELPRWAA